MKLKDVIEVRGHLFPLGRIHEGPIGEKRERERERDTKTHTNKHTHTHTQTYMHSHTELDKQN